METIIWKNAGMRGLSFDFETGNHALGTLTLNEVHSNADFNTGSNRFQFKGAGFWNNRILIRKDNELAGEIKSGLARQTDITLETGAKFRLSSNLMGRNLKWIDTQGHPVIVYTMATLSSRGKGFIQVEDSLTKDEKQILVSAGLVASRLGAHRLLYGALAVAFLFSLLAKLIH